jgi:ABC-type Zn uptake system ZnuABC Zn-binding protein ZnuA/ABC-type Mn2+/Zn2+ transport system permease subunit
MASVLSLPFVQRGFVEIGVLAVAAGVLGTWIVLRGLPFYVHATGTAAFPGLVLADGLGFSAFAGALGTAIVFALLVGVLGRRRGEQDTLIAVLLVGCLAAGVLLASDVFHSGGNVDALLFGSLLLIGGGDIRLAATVAIVAVVTSAVLGERWLARGFDEGAASSLGLRSRATELALVGLVALAVVSSLQAIGGLLVSALFVVPAATTRLFVRRLAPWQLASVVLAALDGAGGLLLSVETDTPPGAAIAIVTGAVFALALAARAAGRRRTLLAAGAVAAVALAGCGGAVGGNGRPVVVATTTQLADVTRAIAGAGTVDVVGILKPNTDPHEYEPRPSDVEATAAAKLVLLNGDRLDAWMGKVVSESGGHPRTLDLGAVVPDRLPGESSGPEASRYDPHWWHDPRNVEAAVPAIRDALARIDPGDAAVFTRRAAGYLRGLRLLDRGLRACFARVSPGARKLVTDHDAFNYFAHRYGITVIGAVIPSQSTQAQASAGALAQLSRTIRRLHVRAVFPESSINPKVAQELARQTGAASHYTLYGDTLGPAGSRGATYLGMEVANADAMLGGFSGGRLGCTVAGLR